MRILDSHGCAWFLAMFVIVKHSQFLGLSIAPFFPHKFIQGELSLQTDQRVCAAL